MKKDYETPWLREIRFCGTDVIRTSGEETTNLYEEDENVDKEGWTNT